MPLDGDVLWFGRPAPWLGALGAPSRACERVADLPALGDSALVVVGEGAVEEVADWLRRALDRPPVVVALAGSDESDEVHALRAGADEVISDTAPPEAARRAAQRAAARHRALCEAADPYRLLVENTADLLTLSDAEGRTLYANPAAWAHTGRSAGEIVDLDPFRTVHPDDVDRVREAYAGGVAENGKSTEIRYRTVGADGQVRVVESAGRPVAGPDGTAYVVGSTRDVTRRAEVEDRLRESEARYRAVVRALPDVVSRLRDDGHAVDFHVPPAFDTEFPADAMLGRRLKDVIPAPLARKFADAVARVRETGDVAAYDYEVEVMGETRHREVRVAPIGEGEVISMIRDVTALREKAAALEQSQAELRALAAHLQEVREEERARLSREVHDVLGQQLTAIRLGVGWFGRRYPDDEAAVARLDRVRETIDETIRHVRQVAADLRPGVLDDFGLESAFEWQVNRFREQSGLDVSLNVEGAAEPPADVATAAFRVLQEALTNVARHANAGEVSVSLSLSDDSVHLVVADDGDGIDGGAVGRRTLGLLGMRERAGALGGALDVRGKHGEGTVVKCTFPLTPPTP